MVDIQEMYYKLAKEFCEEDGMTPERELALQLWGRIIALSREPQSHKALRRLLDWAAKKYLAESDLEQRGYTFQSSSSATLIRESRGRTSEVELIRHLEDLDWQYHLLSGRGLWRKLNEQGFFERIVSDDEIEKAVLDPIPETTRACARAEEIKFLLSPKAQDIGLSFADSCDWTRPIIKWEWPKNTTNPYLDPYDWRPKHPSLIEK